ncbi:siderophore-interacting protein [Vibrio algivorus]|uniref:Siderophore-interacting protein n=1 Tax=Vibrio algivorus TaxID=1667024 RepID=A0A557PFP3_9VIBR|nr:siderophore-interacting protein [Vibrio algivorus]TVO39480.1 siderophore-interacting protein [Vibrio algivorus]
MKPNRKPKLATVVNTFELSENMQRVVLQGEDFKSLQTTDLGDYIKLMFHPEGHTDISTLGEGERPVMRTYTISELDLDNGQFAVDFVKHQVGGKQNIITQEQGGYAIHWAMKAKVGDTISIGGPGNSPIIDLNAEQVFMVADMTAIPAITEKLNTLNQSTTGHAVVQLSSAQDNPNWNLPTGMQLHTIVGHQPSQLSDAVTQLSIENEDVAIWCACEFTAMKAIRTHFNQYNVIQREKSYFSSYWKQGVTEDGHKVIKREDAESLS